MVRLQAIYSLWYAQTASCIPASHNCIRQNLHRYSLHCNALLDG